MSRNSINILKTREDYAPVFFTEVNEGEFKFQGNVKANWLKGDNSFSIKKLRSRIEPWLTALFQSEHLSLLIGSGLTYAVYHLAQEQQSKNQMSEYSFSIFDNIIEKAAQHSAKLAGRSVSNFEDQLRVANDLLVGLKHMSVSLDDKKEQTEQLKQSIIFNLQKFVSSILMQEKDIASAKSEFKEKAFSYLVNFLMSFASRTGTRDRLQIFTTNYDRLIEAGAEVAGLHLLDRFVGSLFPIFRSSRLNIDMHYNPPGIRGEPRYLEGVARFTKLHGSLDWIQVGREIRRIGLPFGATSVEHYLKEAPGLENVDALNFMIYPNSSKDRETSEYPYVELFRDFAAAICRPNNTLVTYGYSFGDEHINRVIEDMLVIPSTHLVVISFDDPMQRIMKTYEKIGRPAQITLLIGNHLGNLKTLVDYYLPKSAIDRTTFRMADLLKARIGAEEKEEYRETSIQGEKNES